MMPKRQGALKWGVSQLDNNHIEPPSFRQWWRCEVRLGHSQGDTQQTCSLNLSLEVDQLKNMNFLFVPSLIYNTD